MRLSWEDEAWEDYLYWQGQDKRTLKRINALIKDIQRTPYEGIGKPEPLRENLSGMWSRRIDEINGSFTTKNMAVSSLFPAGAITIEARGRL